MQVSKQEHNKVKIPVSSHGEEKMEISESLKVALGEQEEWEGETQQTKNIDVLLSFKSFLKHRRILSQHP